jgi:hypothetical protein
MIAPAGRSKVTSLRANKPPKRLLTRLIDIIGSSNESPAVVEIRGLETFSRDLAYRL